MLYKVLNGVKIYTLFIAMLLYILFASVSSLFSSLFFHLHLQLRNDAAKQDELDHVPLLSMSMTTNSANCNLQHRSYSVAIEHSLRRARESTQEDCKFYRRHLKSLPALLQCNRISLSSHFQLTNEKKSTLSSGFELKLYVFLSFFRQNESEWGKLSVLSHHCNHHTMIRWKKCLRLLEHFLADTKDIESFRLVLVYLWKITSSLCKIGAALRVDFVVDLLATMLR